MCALPAEEQHTKTMKKTAGRRGCIAHFSDSVYVLFECINFNYFHFFFCKIYAPITTWEIFTNNIIDYESAIIMKIKKSL